MSGPPANEPAVGLEGGAAELVRQLRATIRRMELALGAIGDGILWTDAAGVIEWCNDTFERAAGRPRILLLGASVYDVLGLEWGGRPLGEADHPVQAALAEGSSTAATYLWSGRGRWLEVSATRCEIAGAATSVIVAVRDVTERRALEAQVRRKSDELTQQYLRLEAADRMKAEFLANMSHELRTPLNSIVGFSALLHDGAAGELTPKQRGYAGHILESGRQLLGLIDGILAFVKAGSDGLGAAEPLDPAACVRGVAAALRAESDRKRLRVDIEIDPDLGTVVGDPGRLRQVVSSLLSNVVKFTPEAGRVCVRVMPEGTDDYRIEVADSGPGIAPADRSRLFVPFQQLDGGTAKQHQGAGLGLALAKRVVEAQGGRIGLEGGPGQGSTFYVVLPRSPARVARAAVEDEAAAGVQRGG